MIFWCAHSSGVSAARSPSEGIDENHPVHVGRIGHRIEPDDEAAIGVHERRLDAGGAQQRMEVGD